MIALSTRPPSTTHTDEAMIARETLFVAISLPQLVISRPRGIRRARSTTPTQNGAASTPVVSSPSASPAPLIDEAASHIAVAVKAEKIFILTNVRGIMKEKEKTETLYESLSMADVETLIQKGIIEGGMIPKTKACIKALEGKVRKAHIIDSYLPHALLLEIFTDKGIGTEISKLDRRTKATEGL